MSQPQQIDPLAQAVMVAYCGWDPTAQVVGATLLLDGTGSTLLTLPSLHVTAVTAVVVTNPDGSTYTATVGPGATDVGWSENGCLIWQSCRNGGAWPEGQRNVAVTYSGGYDVVPADLAAALGSISRRVAGVPVQSQRLGQASITYAQQVAAGGLLLVEQMVLDRYRLPRAA